LNNETRNTLLFWGAMILVVGSIVGLVAYTMPPRPPSMSELMTEWGAIGEKKVKRVDRLPTTTGSVTGAVGGSALFFGGLISGSSKTEMSLIFYWEPKPNEILATTLPYSKFRIVVDDRYDMPSVEFLFSQNFLNSNYTSYENENHINNALSSSHLEAVKVRISEKALATEIYLPK